MNPSLKDFFNEEKKRVLTPDPYFSTRVMARLRDVQPHQSGIWDVVPGSARPVFALALMLLLVFTAVQFFVPQMPERGFVEAALEAEQTAGEAFIYTGAEMPGDQELLNQVMGVEDH